MPPALLLTLALAACGGEEGPKFPPGLEPLDPENLAPASAGGALSFVTGETDKYDWIHARATYAGSVAEAWKVLREAEVWVNRRKVDEWTIANNVDPRVEHSFRIHHVVHSLFTVEFDLTYRQGLSLGTAKVPEGVAVRFEKTAGTSYIEILAGSVVLRKVDDRTTALEFIEHLHATSAGPEEMVAYVKDLHAAVLARLRGEPLPPIQ